MSVEPFRTALNEKISALASKGNGNEASDQSLIVSITKRLGALEKEMKTLNSTLNDKRHEIELLTNYKRDLESILYQHYDEDGMEMLDKLETLKMENQRCKRQIAEMELFLADYGLQWAGYKYDDERMSDISMSTHRDESSNKSANIDNHRGQVVIPQKSDSNEVYFNIEVMMQRIKELNSLVNYQHICKDKHSNIYHFASPPSISLKFYANGLFLRNGPLRPYELHESKQFIRDILDGYFPTELQAEYPNGIIFECENCIDQVCQSNVAHNINADQLISRLPAKLIQDGVIVDFKSQFQVKGNKHKTQDSDVVVLDTPVTKLLQSENCLLSQNQKHFEKLEISTLRIKSSNHNITWMLKMSADDTLSMVYELLSQYLDNKNVHVHPSNTESTKSKAYAFELVCPFPRREYNDLQKTLRDANLVPNATLFLRYI